MSRRRVEVRREEILEAAAAEVTKRGFGHTRVADVSTELGISPALVFYHFGTKEQLFAEALAHAVRRDLDRLDATVAAARDPLDALRRIIAIYAPQGSAPGWTVWVDAWAESLREPGMRRMMASLASRWNEVLAEQITAGVDLGLFDCPDPRGASSRLIGLLDGLSIQVMVHRSLTRTQLGAWARAATARELGLSVEQLA